MVQHAPGRPPASNLGVEATGVESNLNPRYGIQSGQDVGFGSGGGEQAALQEKDGMDNAAIMGLIAAVLGILGNNYGTYGNPMPAIGKGGMMGLETYMGQKKWQDQESMRRQQLAQNNAYMQAQAAQMQAKEQRESEKQQRMFDAQAKVGEALDRLNLAKDDKEKEAANGLLTDAMIRVAIEQGDADKVLALAGKKAGTAGTQYERAFNTLKQNRLKVLSGQKLTVEDQLDNEIAMATVTAPRYTIDPVTQKIVQSSAYSVPQSLGGTGGGLSVISLPTTGGRRQIDAGTEDELTKNGKALSILEAIIPTFKPEFGSYPLDFAANAAIAVNRRLPESVVGKLAKDQADWWMNYYQWAKSVRQAEFGLTLTGNELTSFERATPKPSDDPETVRKSLATQKRIVQEAIDKKINAMREGGYNEAQARAFVYPPKGSTAQDFSGQKKPAKSKEDLKKKYGLD